MKITFHSKFLELQIHGLLCMFLGRDLISYGCMLTKHCEEYFSSSFAVFLTTVSSWLMAFPERCHYRCLWLCDRKQQYLFLRGLLQQKLKRLTLTSLTKKTQQTVFYLNYLLLSGYLVCPVSELLLCHTEEFAGISASVKTELEMVVQ